MLLYEASPTLRAPPILSHLDLLPSWEYLSMETPPFQLETGEEDVKWKINGYLWKVNKVFAPTDIKHTPSTHNTIQDRRICSSSLSLYTTVHPSVHTSTKPYINTSIHLLTHISIHSFIYSPIYQTLHLLIYSSIHQPIHPLIHFKH